MKLERKQIKAILDMTKKNNNALKNLFIEDGYVYATDSYSLIKIATSNKEKGIMKFEHLEIWYKLANNKSFFTDKDLVLSEDKTGVRITNLIPNEINEIDTITYDHKIMDTLIKALGTTVVTLTFNGNHSAIRVHGKNENIEGIILPVRRQQ